MNTYALAIRKINSTEYESPVTILTRGLSIHEARSRADHMNKTHKAELSTIGGAAFVAFNCNAE